MPEAPVKAPPKIEPSVEPEPTRRVNPERICPDQIRRTLEPLVEPLDE